MGSSHLFLIHPTYGGDEEQAKVLERASTNLGYKVQGVFGPNRLRPRYVLGCRRGHFWCRARDFLGRGSIHHFWCRRGGSFFGSWRREERRDRQRAADLDLVRVAEIVERHDLVNRRFEVIGDQAECIARFHDI